MIDKKQNRRYHNAFDGQKGLCQTFVNFSYLSVFFIFNTDAWVLPKSPCLLE